MMYALLCPTSDDRAGVPVTHTSCNVQRDRFLDLQAAATAVSSATSSGGGSASSSASAIADVFAGGGSIAGERWALLVDVCMVRLSSALVTLFACRMLQCHNLLPKALVWHGAAVQQLVTKGFGMAWCCSAAKHGAHTTRCSNCQGLEELCSSCTVDPASQHDSANDTAEHMSCCISSILRQQTTNVAVFYCGCTPRPSLLVAPCRSHRSCTRHRPQFWKRWPGRCYCRC
jgi:hypothetical protein